jgi:hypothetical protein
MMMSKYLYGASVQGIQGFIFATNKLQEIVGASEIVKSVAVEFKKLSGYSSENKNILLNAAGNIKAIFDTKEECEKVVLEFGKIISQMAYGITISQAVVEIADKYKQDDIDELEKRLKTQRNKPSIPLDSSINIMKLNPSTAKPSVSDKEDRATNQKLKSYASIEKDETYKELTKISNSKNKLAVIHIDGNGLGNIVKKMGDKLSSFSVALDKATKQAVTMSITDNMKIREIIVGGDDVTVICSANDALEFTKNFLQNFEDNTKKIKELDCKLTACAGIAYCNEKYPFHYAVDLAEALCGVAKNHCKRESSCLMFHNIQSSSYQEWDKFVEDELTIKNDQETIRCDFGAYYLDNKNEANISDFMNTLEAYRCDNSPISRLRNWLSELYKSDTNAKLLLHRINSIVKQNDNWNCETMNKNLKYFDNNLSNDTLIIKKDGHHKTPIYDILQILSITEAK